MNIELLDFYAEWCNPCKSYSKILEEFKGKYPQVNIKSYDIDSDEGDVLVKEFGIRNIPYTVIKIDGKVVLQKAGILTLSELEEVISPK